jgi:hypothetical protein
MIVEIYLVGVAVLNITNMILWLDKMDYSFWEWAGLAVIWPIALVILLAKGVKSGLATLWKM